MKWEIPFRYDPAVLIVSIRFQRTAHSFGKVLRDRLLISYGGNEQSVSHQSLCAYLHKLIHIQVMLVERAVDGSDGTNYDAGVTHSNDTSLAERFLSDHESAKIVVVVDTHSVDNGYFVWTGASAESYRACSLIEVCWLCLFCICILIVSKRYSGIVARRGFSSTYLMQMTPQSIAISRSF